jgi:hypothetical protein
MEDTNVDYYTKELDILILFDGRHEYGLLQLEMIYFNYICMAAFIAKSLRCLCVG